MDWGPACSHPLRRSQWSLTVIIREDRIRAFDLNSDSIGFPTQWSLQNQARHGAASPPDVRRTQAMESGEHAGPGVPVPPSLGKPRMGGECPQPQQHLPPNNPEIHKAQLPSHPVTRRRSRMDEATWYLDSDDSSPLGSPSTPPTLNGE